ncbi:MAG: YibE/F family protein [bacterium]
MNTINHTTFTIIVLMLTLCIGGLLLSAPAHAVKPKKGNYHPSDLNIKIHPFMEHVRFGGTFHTGTLVNKTDTGWLVRINRKSSQTKIIPNARMNIPDPIREAGQRILLKAPQPNRPQYLLVIDVDRRYKFLWLGLACLLLCAVVGGWITMRALSGVIIGVLYFLYWSIPQMQAGSPVLLEIMLFYVLVTVLVLPASLGWNRKALSAIAAAISTGLISLAILIPLANWLEVSGLRNEIMQVLEYGTRYFPELTADYNFRYIIVGATLIGALGVILDVAVDVTSSTAEIARSRPDLPFGEILNRTITVSSRLVGTMTNTLLLAYIGADMFLLITVYILPTPLRVMLNQDFVAVEVLRGLGGALGFLAAVPLSVLFYVIFHRFTPFEPAPPNPPDNP